MATLPVKEAIFTSRVFGAFQAKEIWLKALFAFLLAVIFLQWTPNHLFSFEQLDSGIFMYVGEQLRRGLPLYRSVWDHKPPLIFYFNELGLRLGNGPPVGVYFLYYFTAVSFFVISLHVIRRLATGPASLLSCMWGILLFADLTALGPNSGEVICLPLQAVAFYLLVKDLQEEVTIRRALLQGIILSLLFWTKPNCIAVTTVYFSSIAFVLLRRRAYDKLVKIVAVFATSILISGAAIVLPAVAQSSWAEVWFATFEFNKIYASLVTNSGRIHALLWLIFTAAPHGVILLAIAGFFLILIVRPSAYWHGGLSQWAVLFWFTLEAASAAYREALWEKRNPLDSALHVRDRPPS